jgi:hypothetical protein
VIEGEDIDVAMVPNHLHSSARVYSDGLRGKTLTLPWSLTIYIAPPESTLMALLSLSDLK